MRIAVALLVLVPHVALATTYDVGPGQTYTTIGSVPWESLVAGDTVNIHYQPTPYAEKWVIGVNGTAAQPITIQGVPDPVTGALPVITGNNATTRSQLNYTNEDRAVIKIGTANVPNSTNPTYIVVANLDVMSARPPYTFTNAAGTAGVVYQTDAASIWVETGTNITITNCVFEDSGNGFFTSNGSSTVLVQNCYYHDNGISGSAFEHNNYTESNGITFQFNHFGPCRAGCDGNNLKDRSAGCVIRYNFFEEGNRSLDLVDSAVLNVQASYADTYVYGNVFQKSDAAGNEQFAHFGGDSGTTSQYRTNLFFYDNTLYSTRSGFTTLFLLDTNSQTADVRNNIIFATSGAANMAISDSGGIINLSYDWLQTGYVVTHNGSLNPGAAVNVGTGVITGTDPGFNNPGGQDFTLKSTSPCLNVSGPLAGGAPSVTMSYLEQQKGQTRSTINDLGAYELGAMASGGGGGGSSPAIQVTPATFGYGNVAVGSTGQTTFIVTNTGGGTLTGSASVSAPFSVTSGGSYSLTAGQSAPVVIAFTPTTAGAASGTATFTGAAGASVPLSGTGTTSGGGSPPPPFIGGGGGHGGGCEVAPAAPGGHGVLLLLALLLLARRSRR